MEFESNAIWYKFSNIRDHVALTLNRPVNILKRKHKFDGIYNTDK